MNKPARIKNLTNDGRMISGHLKNTFVCVLEDKDDGRGTGVRRPASQSVVIEDNKYLLTFIEQTSTSPVCLLSFQHGMFARNTQQ